MAIFPCRCDIERSKRQSDNLVCPPPTLSVPKSPNQQLIIDQSPTQSSSQALVPFAESLYHLSRGPALGPFAAHGDEKAALRALLLGAALPQARAEKRKAKRAGARSANRGLDGALLSLLFSCFCLSESERHHAAVLRGVESVPAKPSKPVTDTHRHSPLAPAHHNPAQQAACIARPRLYLLREPTAAGHAGAGVTAGGPLDSSPLTLLAEVPLADTALASNVVLVRGYPRIYMGACVVLCLVSRCLRCEVVFCVCCVFLRAR